MSSGTLREGFNTLTLIFLLSYSGGKPALSDPSPTQPNLTTHGFPRVHSDIGGPLSRNNISCIHGRGMSSESEDQCRRARLRATMGNWQPDRSSRVVLFGFRVYNIQIVPQRHFALSHVHAKTWVAVNRAREVVKKCIKHTTAIS
jgi:hypothetical protein